MTLEQQEAIRAEEEAAYREHIFMLTRGRSVPDPVANAPQEQDPAPPEPPVQHVSYDEWVADQKYLSRPLLAAFRIVATRNNWYYCAPSFWEQEFTSWSNAPA